MTFPLAFVLAVRLPPVPKVKPTFAPEIGIDRGSVTTICWGYTGMSRVTVPGEVTRKDVP